MTLNKSETILKFIKDNPHIDSEIISEELCIGECTGLLTTLFEKGLVTRIKDVAVRKNGKRHRVWHYTAVKEPEARTIIHKETTPDLFANTVGASITGLTGISLPVIDVPQLDVKKTDIGVSTYSFNINNYTIGELRCIHSKIGKVLEALG